MKSMNFCILALIVLLGALSEANCQQRLIYGIVTDHEGNPLKGVVVSPKDQNTNVSTDQNGYYEISVENSILTLVFETTGMKNASASIGLYDEINVKMCAMNSEESSDLSLEDLVNMEVDKVSDNIDLAGKNSDIPESGRYK